MLAVASLARHHCHHLRELPPPVPPAGKKGHRIIHEVRLIYNPHEIIRQTPAARNLYWDYIYGNMNDIHPGVKLLGKKSVGKMYGSKSKISII